MRKDVTGKKLGAAVTTDKAFPGEREMTWNI